MASSAHTAASSAQEQLFNLSMAESTLFWTGLSFFVLLLVVWRYVAPVVSDILDQRSARIQEDMDKAASLREQAQQALAEYETRLKLAKKEAQEIVAHAKAEAENMIATKTAELERDIARRSEEAKVAIEQAKAKAMRDVRAELVDLAVIAAEKIITSEVDKKKASALTDDILKTMN